MTFHPMSGIDPETFCRALGLLGFSLYVAGFLGLSLGRLSSGQPTYFVLVLLAASCVLVSLWADFNLSAALIQGFYILMALGAIFMRLPVRRRRKRSLRKRRTSRNSFAHSA